MEDSSEDLQHIIYESPNYIDKILSRELTKLSLEDRNALDEEIHGVSTLAPTETPNFLRASLQELSKELSEIPEESKQAYLESQLLPETYVNSSDFRLRFLRCELFDAKKAAIRMSKFLDFASHLFGPVVLKRPMRITDLTLDEKKWMENHQILPYRDQSGRPIAAWIGDHELQKRNPYSRWRVILYFRYCKSEDIETQQKGFVSLIWVRSIDIFYLPGWENFTYAQKMNAASPVRKCSVHWCLPELPSIHPIQVMRSAHTLSMGKNRSRVKFHVGNTVELMYKLKGYGIPVEWIPVTETGNTKKTYLKQWIKGRERLEEEMGKGSDAISIILCPGSKDVLFQSGNKVKSHPGNIVFDRIVGGRLKEHFFSSQSEKEAITRAIILEVQQRGGRFLQRVKDGWWTEMEESGIHAKVALKIRRTTGKITTVQQTSQSSTYVFSNKSNGKRRKLSDGSSQSSAEGCCSFVF